MVSQSNVVIVYKHGLTGASEETLSSAHIIATQANKISKDSTAASCSEKDGNDRIMADAAIVYSDLSLQRGKAQEALLHAKRSLRIIARAWKRAERHQMSRARSLSCEQITVEKLTEETSHMSMSTAAVASSPAQNSIVGPSAWMLARPMFRSFIHLSQVYAHHGMFQDTIYYAEQAHKIAINIDSTYYIAEALALMGSAWLKAGTIDKACEFLTQAKSIGSVYKETQASVILNGHLGSLYNRQGDKKAELAAYDDAELTLKSLISPTYINDLDRILDAAVMLETEMSRLAIDNRKKQPILPRKRVLRAPTKKGEAISKTLTRRAPTKKAPISKTLARRAPTKKEAASKTMTDPLSSISDQSVHLLSLRGALLRQKARSFIQWDRSEEATAIMEEADFCSFGLFDVIDNHVTLAEQLFQQSLALLPADSVYSVLQESTISFPAIVGAKTAPACDRALAVRSPLPRRNHNSSLRNPSHSRGLCTTWVDPLKQAHEHLLEAYATASQVASTSIINTIASFLNTTTLLLSTYHGNKQKATHPGTAASTLGKSYYFTAYVSWS